MNQILLLIWSFLSSKIFFFSAFHLIVKKCMSKLQLLRVCTLTQYLRSEMLSKLLSNYWVSFILLLHYWALLFSQFEILQQPNVVPEIENDAFEFVWRGSSRYADSSCGFTLRELGLISIENWKSAYLDSRGPFI